jgi:alkanesulfonate monooxygenase SsuD/methylene tetrahydromethanopterin reductase-like flavin-dependent oxidoreductase (luciferase family)
MQFGLDVPTTEAYADPRVLAQLAEEAEQAGWNGFFVWDVLGGVDLWLALAAIALRTERITIGPMVLALARHRPWLAAKRLADLDHLSGGRVICTVGLGHTERDFTQFGEAGDPTIRAAKLDEGLAVMDGLWRAEQFSFAGSHYTLHDAAITPKPMQSPHIPLWVCGGWPRRGPFRRAAQWDGMCLMSVHATQQRRLSLEEFREAVAYVRAQRMSTYVRHGLAELFE